MSRCVLQDLAAALLDLLAATTTTTIIGLARFPRRRRDVSVPVLLFDGHYSVHCQLEDRVHAAHLFAAALYVRCVHPTRHGLALLWRYRRQTLRFQKLNACSLVAQVGFQPNEDDRSRRAEMQYLRIPLSSLDGPA